MLIDRVDRCDSAGSAPSGVDAGQLAGARRRHQSSAQQRRLAAARRAHDREDAARREPADQLSDQFLATKNRSRSDAWNAGRPRYGHSPRTVAR